MSCAVCGKRDTPTSAWFGGRRFWFCGNFCLDKLIARFQS